MKEGRRTWSIISVYDAFPCSQKISLQNFSNLHPLVYRYGQKTSEEEGKASLVKFSRSSEKKKDEEKKN